MISSIRKKNPEYGDVQYIDQVRADAEKVLGESGRGWQVTVLKQFQASRLNRLVAPCGSGKSTAQVALAIRDIINSDYSRLQLFVMPQTHIADGFFKQDGLVSTLKIGNKVFTVSVNAQHNFCQASSLRRLKRLLLMDRKLLARQCDGNSISGLFAMTSYSALGGVWDMMSNAERLQAIKNLHLRLDESHHVSAGENPNKVGKIFRFIAEQGGNSSRITLTTATDFRGDKEDIIPFGLQKEINSHRVDWIEHWKTLGIKDLLVEIQEIDGSPVKNVVRNISRERGEYHYIAVPPRNAGWRMKARDESNGVDGLVAKLRKQWPNARILNLVPQEEGRAAKKRSLLDEPKRAADGDPQYNIVITCMLGREGTDWCPCSRLHVTYPEGSITLAVQTLGRLLRRFAGKQKVVARYYYPKFSIPEKGMTKDELLDDRKNALLLMMQIDEMYYPILFPSLPRDKQQITGRMGHEGSLEEFLGTTEYRNLREEFLDEVVDRGITGTDAAGLDAVIDELLVEYDVPAEYHDDARDTLRVMFLRAASPKFRGIDVAFVRQRGFPKLYAKLSRIDRTLVFRHGVRRMKLLQQIVREHWDVMFEEYKKRFGKKQ